MTEYSCYNWAYIRHWDAKTRQSICSN